MNKKEKQQVKYLLENLKWYVEASNEQDYNGEYEPPMEWEQGEAKTFLKYLEEKDKEIERLNNIINKAIKKLNKYRNRKDTWGLWCMEYGDNAEIIKILGGKVKNE